MTDKSFKSTGFALKFGDDPDEQNVQADNVRPTGLD